MPLSWPSWSKSKYPNKTFEDVICTDLYTLILTVEVHTTAFSLVATVSLYTGMNSLIGFHKLWLRPSIHLFSAAYLELGYIISLVCSWSTLGAPNKLKCCWVRATPDIYRCPTAEVDTEVDQETRIKLHSALFFSIHFIWQWDCEYNFAEFCVFLYVRWW